MRREISAGLALGYVTVQIAGGVAGVWVVHLMFDLPLVQIGATARSGIGQWTAEIVACFGLVLTILGGLRHRPEAVPALVALFITAAYWFTASTSFANPAVTVARSFTDTFTGIAPAHPPVFILMQLIGAALAVLLARRLFPKVRPAT
jgi:glycerol uptake facilitator-like aquaporin